MINHPEDFTLAHYRKLLEIAKATHEFISYKDALSGAPGILWRHDLDLSVEAAWQLAKIEHDAGVKANYFFLLHSPFYNPFDRNNYPLLKEIIDMGHHVGLHLDSHIYNISSEQELDHFLNVERTLLNLMFGINAEVFSFHLTNHFTMSCEDDAYGGMINAYSKHIKSAYPYCSDSYGFWRFSRLIDFLQDHQHTANIQVLTHPEWWIFDIMEPKSRISEIIKRNEMKLWEDAHKSYIYESRVQ